MKKYEYMVTSIVIKKADEIIKVLSNKQIGRAHV